MPLKADIGVRRILLAVSPFQYEPISDHCVCTVFVWSKNVEEESSPMLNCAWDVDFAQTLNRQFAGIHGWSLTRKMPLEDSTAHVADSLTENVCLEPGTYVSSCNAAFVPFEESSFHWTSFMSSSSDSRARFPVVAFRSSGGVFLWL